MENNVFFMHQIKHTNGVFDKGIVVKSEGTSEENFDAAKQAFHAYLGAYAYGHDANTDFVDCKITDMSGNVLKPWDETWIKAEAEPEEE